MKVTSVSRLQVDAQTFTPVQTVTLKVPAEILLDMQNRGDELFDNEQYMVFIGRMFNTAIMEYNAAEKEKSS